MAEAAVKLTKKDFETDQDVRWCPGCGDYSVLANVQRLLPDLGIPRENFVFISGIGCSSRFPYYMKTYGFHTIHGRAPAIASGLKTSRPELSVWVITGDGDALSIGGNHLIHTLRRNIDLNILLFNNRVYGLTKGQYSPTSEVGMKTKSSPMGSVDAPFNPIMLTLGTGATFVSRSIDIEAKHLKGVMRAAHEHKGSSFVEIYQNCPIFNDGVFSMMTDRKVKSEHVVQLEHGQPLVFGKELDKGVRLVDGRFEVVELGNGLTEADLHVHDETDRGLAFSLAQLEMPVPVGIFYREARPTTDELINAQLEESVKAKGKGDLQKLLTGTDTWEVE